MISQLALAPKKKCVMIVGYSLMDMMTKIAVAAMARTAMTMRRMVVLLSFFLTGAGATATEAGSRDSG